MGISSHGSAVTGLKGRLVNLVAVKRSIATAVVAAVSDTVRQHFLRVSGDAGIRCDIVDFAYPLPPAPDGNCGHGESYAGFGHEIVLERGTAARFGRPGDSLVNPAFELLGYGSSTSFGGVDCTSTAAFLLRIPLAFVT